ncbi:putative manganese-dependent inorganic diphosphatase [Kiritimatiellaeota bacterium B1221]|nr:putative manganese-dependent inorganic diphosphatase [Kiritimatiellaeota bacterium B1221]
MDKPPVYVIGHRNPDTDAICSVISYADLLRRTRYPEAIPAACGTANLRTEFALETAGVPHPKLLMDVRPTTSQICRTNVMVTREEEPFMEVYRRMQQHRLKAIPVINNDQKVVGLLTLLQLMHMLIPDENDLGEQRILNSTLSQVRSVLGGTFQNEVNINKHEQLVMFIGAMSRDGFKDRIKNYPTDRLMVLVGDRPTIQAESINMGVRVIVITGGFTMKEELVEKAKEKGVVVISSPLDTAMTALLVRTAKPVSQAMDRDFITFDHHELLHTIRDRVQEAGQDLFPVLDDEERLYGVFAKSDMIDPQPAKLILLDHNEYSQAVKGAPEAQILEVIDHHRIGGGLHSREPIRFMNDTVGSTCTMVARLFRQHAIMPEPGIALCMASGIISDTLFLKSPTTTDVDKDILSWLRQYLPVNLDDYARDFFAEGSTLSISSSEEVLASDRKTYTENDWTISISQAEELGMERFWERKEDLEVALKNYVATSNDDFACLMITDITTQASYLLTAGNPRIIAAIDYPSLDKNLYDLPGVVSRKKQLLPQLIRVLNRVHH